jgi:hypothetical protein
VAQIDTMKLHKSTRPNKSGKFESVLRGRAEPELKDRVAKFAQAQERSEGYVVRQAVREFLDREERNLAAA